MEGDALGDGNVGVLLSDCLADGCLRLDLLDARLAQRVEVLDLCVCVCEGGGGGQNA
jgi:hypothetical protein